MESHNVVYRYDGTLDGLFSCVFEGYEKKEVPLALVEWDEPCLMAVRDVPTVAERADRVRAGLIKRAGAESLLLVETAFLNGGTDKAMWIERFIRLCFAVGRDAIRMRGDEAVSHTHDLAQAATREAHLLKGFLRFTDYGGFLGSVIEPKHHALPLLKAHFCERYNAETFLIHDKVHGQALLYQPYEARIVQVDELELPHTDSDEQWLQKLWRGYFKAVTIEPRVNYKLQRQMLPLRFRAQMVEMQAESPNGQNDALPVPQRRAR